MYTPGSKYSVASNSTTSPNRIKPNSGIKTSLYKFGICLSPAAAVLTFFGQSTDAYVNPWVHVSSFRHARPGSPREQRRVPLRLGLGYSLRPQRAANRGRHRGVTGRCLPLLHLHGETVQRPPLPALFQALLLPLHPEVANGAEEPVPTLQVRIMESIRLRMACFAGLFSKQ